MLPPSPPTGPRLILGGAMLVALLAGSVVVRDCSSRAVYRTTGALTQSHSVIRALERVLTDAVDSETGERGYLITGEEAYLEPYQAADARLDDHLTSLSRLVQGDPEQTADVVALERMLAVKQDQLRETIDVYRSRGPEAARALVATGRSKAAMDGIRAHVQRMQQRERARLEERARVADQRYQLSAVTGLATGVLGVVMTLAFVWLARRSAREQAVAAAALFQQREHLRVTLASVGDGMIATDTAQRVTSLNAVAEQLTGWSQADAIGQDIERVFAVVNEQSRDHVDNPVARALREGVIVGLANHTVLIARDGTERPIADSAAPIRDADGTVLGAVLVFRDVSDEREAALALNRALAREQAWAERLRQLAAASITINAAATADSIVGVISAEARRMLGAGRCEVIFDRDAIAEETGHLVVGLRSRSGRGLGYVHCADKTDGAFSDDDRAVLTQLAQMASIALENSQLYKEIRASDLRKDEFLATLAHELRNPLAPISHSLEVLRATDDPERVAQSRAVIERQVAQLVHLVDDLLDVSRVSRGKLELRQRRVLLSDVLKAAIETSRPAVDAQQHTLRLVEPAQPVWLEADLTRLAQVFANLLNNAAKYMEPGGAITVEATAGDDHVEVSVRDTGVGMAPDVLPHVFDMFVQADRSLDRAQGGLGIGLTLVRRLVDLHKGTVRAHSDGPGKGSQFTVRLPRVDGPAGREVPRATATSGPLPARRILVVDDNKDAVDSLSLLLQIVGQTVAAARDGLEAVATFAQFRPDVIVLDIGLPGLNGYEVARRIRAADGGRQVVLVALTGWGQDEDRRRTLDAGFDYHLVKPVDFEALQALLRGLPRR